MRLRNQSSVQGGGGMSGMSTQLMPICLIFFISDSVGSAEMYMVSLGVSGPSCGMPLVSEAALRAPVATRQQRAAGRGHHAAARQEIVFAGHLFLPFCGPAYPPVSWA